MPLWYLNFAEAQKPMKHTLQIDEVFKKGTGLLQNDDINVRTVELLLQTAK